jgi:hypothetical protein
MAGTPFYDAGTVAQLAINLFYGWGYNFYRLENQLRADDLMIRAKVSEILGAARGGVEAAEAAYRREFLPPPSREKPRPDPAAILGAQALEAIGRELGAIEGRIRSLPVPENDRMTQRFRREAETLSRLAEADQAMVGNAEFLRSLLAPATGPWMIENAGEIRHCIASIKAAVQARGELLSV